MTRYRTIGVGYGTRLQYETEKKGLFGVRHVWLDVPKAWSRWPYPRGYFADIGLNYEERIQGMEACLEFVKDYPDIEKYWPDFERAQSIYAMEWDRKEFEHLNGKNKITYLTP